MLLLSNFIILECYVVSANSSFPNTHRTSILFVFVFSCDSELDGVEFNVKFLLSAFNVKIILGARSLKQGNNECIVHIIGWTLQVLYSRMFYYHVIESQDASRNIRCILWPPIYASNFPRFILIFDYMGHCSMSIKI